MTIRSYVPAVYFSNIGGQNHVSFGKEAIEAWDRNRKYRKFLNLTLNVILGVQLPDTPDHTRVNSIILSALVLNNFVNGLCSWSEEMGQADGYQGCCYPTVPAYFTSDQRAATKNAGRIAGFNVLRIIQ